MEDNICGIDKKEPPWKPNPLCPRLHPKPLPKRYAWQKMPGTAGILIALFWSIPKAPAGVTVSKLAVDIDESNWDFVLDTNLKGAWLVALEAGKRMIAAGQPGSIVNTASLLGLRVAISQSAYATSKAAVIQLTKSLALEWCRKGIRVNALCPGYFVTEMNREYFASEKGQAYIAGMPARRTGNLDELTGPFMLLASDAGSFINGVALPVDGGHSIGNM